MKPKAAKPYRGFAYVTPKGVISNVVGDRPYIKSAAAMAFNGSEGRYGGSCTMPDDFTKATAAGWRVIRVRVAPV